MHISQNQEADKILKKVGTSCLRGNVIYEAFRQNSRIKRSKGLINAKKGEEC